MGDVKKITYCGLISALSVAIMFIGGAVSFLDYSVSGLCGAFLVVVVLEIGKNRAFFVYLTVSALSLILISEKNIALTYILIFGYYPMLKSSIEKLNARILEFFLKLSIFLISNLLYFSLSALIFGLDFLMESGFLMLVLSFLTSILTSQVYDIFLSCFAAHYIKVLRPKLFKHIFK